MTESEPTPAKFSRSQIHLAAGRAWGKVILLGEHAVVYGVPALAIGIDRGAFAWVEGFCSGRLNEGATHASKAAPRAGVPCRLFVEGWDISVSEEDAHHDLGRAFRALLDAARAKGGTIKDLSVRAKSDLPPGGGLGCSAALGVAIARAVSPHAGNDEVQELAMAWERIFHGNPSGVDAAVASCGGGIFFQKGRGIEPVKSRNNLLLCVGSTGIASSTKTMVESVARLYGRRREVVEKAFEGIRALVNNGRLAMEAGDRVGLGRLLDLNQMILGGLFVSTEEIERMCSAARQAGALGAKLTGAGGGGCVVALVGGTAIAERVLAAWKEEGFSGFSTQLGGVDAPHLDAVETAP
jgi:mevalonate kinase